MPEDRAILFLQLGGPENLEEVPRFLYRLFSDPDVIRVRPAVLRQAIAGAIAIGRKRASRALYRSIGGGSPSVPTGRARSRSSGIASSSW